MGDIWMTLWLEMIVLLVQTSIKVLPSRQLQSQEFLNSVPGAKVVLFGSDKKVSVPWGKEKPHPFGVDLCSICWIKYRKLLDNASTDSYLSPRTQLIKMVLECRMMVFPPLPPPSFFFLSHLFSKSKQYPHFRLWICFHQSLIPIEIKTGSLGLLRSMAVGGEQAEQV